MNNVNKKVICIGSAGKDIFFPVSSGIVLETGNELNKKKQFCFGYGGKVHVEDRFSASGGCACNVSIGLARLGVDVTAMGNVGNDFDGQWIIEVLKREGVDVNNMKIISNQNTDISVIIVDENTGERTIFVNRDVGEKLNIVRTDVEGFGWYYMGSLYGDEININIKIIHKILAKGNVKLAYNPGGKNIEKDEDIVLDLIYHAAIVFVNKSEAKAIVSKFDLSYNKKQIDSEEYLMSIIKKHMLADDGIVVLTDGLRGAWSFAGEEIYHTNVIDKLVKDSTGAGDAFASGFFAGIIHDLTLQKSMQWGSINGDAVVDYYGAQEGLMKKIDIDKKLKLFKVDTKKIDNGII
jgi:sugar/nucleoside kinase (ribokinase family)